MKKALFLIASIIYSITCFAQQHTNLNNIANIDLPNASEKITKEQGMAHMQQKFKGKKASYESFLIGNPQHAYKIGDVVVSLHTDDHPVSAGKLLDTKKGLDYLWRANKTYTSVIKQINNNQVLMLNYVQDEVHYYYFFAYNASNTKVVTGSTACDNNDSKKAENILDQILNSIKFKE